MDPKRSAFTRMVTVALVSFALGLLTYWVFDTWVYPGSRVIPVALSPRAESGNGVQSVRPEDSGTNPVSGGGTGGAAVDHSNTRAQSGPSDDAADRLASRAVTAGSVATDAPATGALATDKSASSESAPGISSSDLAEPGSGSGLSSLGPAARIDPRDVDKPDGPMLAIVIDDLGYGLQGTDQILALPYPITVSVLPRLNKTAVDYKKAVASGHEVMLHLPMEPENDAVSPGEGAITTGMTEEKIRELLDEHLSEVKGATAVNNHMGSLATADRRVMDILMHLLKERGLTWVDSSTTPDSVGPEAAREAGVPVLVNNSFLDVEKTNEYITNRLRMAAELARSNGHALVIGHVSMAMAETLAEELPKIASSGIRLVTVDTLLRSIQDASVGQ